MPCSKLKKSLCIADTSCEWVTGKGCRKQKKSAITLPSTSSVSIVSKAAKQSVLKSLFPNMQMSKEFTDASDKFIYNCAKYILHTTKKNLGVDDISKGFKIAELAPHFKTNAREAFEKKQSEFYEDNFESTIEATFGKHLTKDAAYYLAGGLCYLYILFTDKAGNYAKQHGKVRITQEHIKQSMKFDNAFIDLFAAFK